MLRFYWAAALWVEAVSTVQVYRGKIDHGLDLTEGQSKQAVGLLEEFYWKWLKGDILSYDFDWMARTKVGKNKVNVGIEVLQKNIQKQQRYVFISC